MVKNKDYTFAQILAKKKEIAYIFLGIGITMFLLNIVTFITYVVTPEYPYLIFDLSVFSSIILIVSAVFSIYNK